METRKGNNNNNRITLSSCGRNAKEVTVRMLEKVSKYLGKAKVLLAGAVVAASNAAAQTSGSPLSLPATAETQLSAIITENFGIVIGVVIVVVGAGLLIKMIRKAG